MKIIWLVLQAFCVCVAIESAIFGLGITDTFVIMSFEMAILFKLEDKSNG